MKKLIIAVCLLIVTAAFEQKAATRPMAPVSPVSAVQAMDSLASKLETLNKIQGYEK